MQQGKPSRTALRVAIRRAAHQLVDHPPILHDPVAVRLIGPGHARDLERASHTVARDFRCFMAARSNWTENHLATAVAAGLRQYVILGAGLDTFAYRNPFPHLRVFEVDFPATQEWKRWMLAQAAIQPPANVTFVPVDFERQTLAERLAESGFNSTQPAFFCWLGVVPYLTLDTFRATLAFIGSLPPFSGLALDYVLPPDRLTPERRAVFDLLAARVAAEGEPFQLFFTSDQIESELRRAGFHRVEQADHEKLNQLYFCDRTDGLKLSASGAGMLAAGWV